MISAFTTAEIQSPPEAPVPIAQFDHLVVAATNLAQGVDYLQKRLQVPLEPGGQHQLMGTHNALLRLGDSCYLEIIAIDPSAPAPDRPRWFNLGNPQLQTALQGKPRLIHWVARTLELTSLQSSAEDIFGAIVPMTRGTLQWRITVPADGRLPGGGGIPSLIHWQTEQHPAGLLPERECSLRSLQAFTPETARTLSAIRLLGLQDMIEIRAGELPRLRAEIKTPAGIKVLE